MWASSLVTMADLVLFILHVGCSNGAASSLPVIVIGVCMHGFVCVCDVPILNVTST